MQHSSVILTASVKVNKPLMNPAHDAVRGVRNPHEQKGRIKKWTGSQKEKHPTWKWYLRFPHSYISKGEAFDGK